MLEHGWDIVKLLAADATILYASPATRRILGHDPESMAGKPGAKELHPDDAARVTARFAEIVASPTGEPFTLTYRCRCADGSYKWMEGVFTNLLGEPDVAAVVLNERDVTDRKRAQEDRDELLVREQHARAQAEAASRAKDSFLSIVSHELRTPLTPVLLCVSDLQRDAGLSERAREELAMIREQIELEAQIIDDLLDLTRLGQGRLHLNTQAVDAHDVLRDALDAAGREVRDKQLDVSVDLRATCSRMTADPRRLRQVFWNVLANAAKFTPAGGSVTIRTEDAPGCRLRVSVTDTGIGFRPDVVDHLFRPFEQAEQSLTRRFGGLGLGLTIAKELVDLHRGTISASSAGPDRGATFTLEFPASPAAPAQPAAAKPVAPLPLSILLVEDNPQTLAAMSRLLKSVGHRVHTATTIDSALRTIEDHPVDLMVCDIGLPDGSGWELLRRASAIRTVPAIALSGFGSDDDIDRSRRTGFAAHLVKPVTPQKLHDAIRQATLPPRTPATQAAARPILP
jgi:PAS domain S-box-containing protein